MIPSLQIPKRTVFLTLLVMSAAVAAALASPPPSSRPTTAPATAPTSLPTLPDLPAVPALPPGLADNDKDKEKPPPYPAPGELDAVEKLKKRGCTVERSPFGGDYAFIFWGKERDITDDDLALFRFIPGVTHIDLSGNKKVTDAGIRHLRGLRFLRTVYLRNTAVTDAALPDLAKIERLDDLSLLFTAVTEKAAEKFAKENPKIRTSY